MSLQCWYIIQVNSSRIGKANSEKKGFPIVEFGLKNGVWYNCEVEGCWLAQKKVSGQVCCKV